MGLSDLETKLFDSVEFCLALLGALPMPVFLVDEDDNCNTVSSFDSSSFKNISFLSNGEETKNTWDLDMENPDCVFAKAVKLVRETNEKVHIKGKWTAKKNKMITDMIVTVHAVAANINDKNYVIVIMEDQTELEQLKGLLPICMECNKIYNAESHDWDQLEEYISHNSSANFSHGLCPDCGKKIINKLENNDWGKGTHER